MGSLFLIPWPKTGWSEAGRIASRTPLPLSDAGRCQARDWAAELAAPGLDLVFSSRERVSVETARIVAERTRARHKILVELAEVDAGLWDGLAAEELQHRYPKIFKRWQADPSSVCPPEGEELADAVERLRVPLARVTHKPGGRSLGVVAGPTAFAVLRCLIELVEPAKLRSMMHDAPVCYPLDGGNGTAGRGVPLEIVAEGSASGADAPPTKGNRAVP